MSIFDDIDASFDLALRELKDYKKRKPVKPEDPPDDEAWEAASVAAAIIDSRHPELSHIELSLHKNKMLFYFAYKNKSTQVLVPNDMVRTIKSALDVFEKIITEQIDYYTNDKYGKGRITLRDKKDRAPLHGTI